MCVCVCECSEIVSQIAYHAGAHAAHRIRRGICGCLRSLANIIGVCVCVFVCLCADFAALVLLKEGGFARECHRNLNEAKRIVDNTVGELGNTQIHTHRTQNKFGLDMGNCCTLKLFGHACFSGKSGIMRDFWFGMLTK